MSYISAIRQGENVLVWERNNPEYRELKTYPAPYYFYMKSELVVDWINGGTLTAGFESMYGDKLDRSLLDLQGVCDRPGTSATAPDQRQPDCIVLPGVCHRSNTAKHRRPRNRPAALFEKISSIE